MKIKSVLISNFRSIKELWLEPSNLCALIGPNGSGKTNVLKAIDLVLGEGWTTKAKVARELFNEPDSPIKIEIAFDEPVNYLSKNGKSDSIKSVELEMCLRPELSAKTTINGGQTFYSHDVFKKHCHFIFIPADRQLSDELRVSQWTMLGKIMRTIYESYVDSYDGDVDKLKEDFKALMVPPKSFLERDFATRPKHVTFEKFIGAFKKYCKLNSSGFANEFQPLLDIYNLNWFYRTLQIHVQEEGSPFQFDSEEVGSGMQNLLVLSIFQTYAELMGGSAILGIEEPEIYLYPQAQRSLYKTFAEIAASSQIFYTTHNPNFVDASRPDDVVLLRKSADLGTFLLEKNPYFSTQTAEREKHRIYTHFNNSRNELFFSRKVLFVEGPSDKILFSILCEEKWKLDLDKHGFVIIDCGGKAGVNYFVGVANLIGLGSDDFFAVWDGDEGTYSPKKDFLKETLATGSGFEIPRNLELFLGIKDSDKVRGAYNWAKSINLADIPKEFGSVRAFFNRISNPSYGQEPEDALSAAQNLDEESLF